MCGCVINHWKAHEKEISTGEKYFSLPHPLPSLPKIGPGPKLTQTDPEYVSNQECLMASCTNNTKSSVMSKLLL